MGRKKEKHSESSGWVDAFNREFIRMHKSAKALSDSRKQRTMEENNKNFDYSRSTSGFVPDTDDMFQAFYKPEQTTWMEEFVRIHLKAERFYEDIVVFGGEMHPAGKLMETALEKGCITQTEYDFYMQHSK